MPEVPSYIPCPGIRGHGDYCDCHPQARGVVWKAVMSDLDPRRVPGLRSTTASPFTGTTVSRLPEDPAGRG